MVMANLHFFTSSHLPSVILIIYYFLSRNVTLFLVTKHRKRLSYGDHFLGKWLLSYQTHFLNLHEQGVPSFTITGPIYTSLCRDLFDAGEKERWPENSLDKGWTRKGVSTCSSRINRGIESRRIRIIFLL